MKLFSENRLKVFKVIFKDKDMVTTPKIGSTKNEGFYLMRCDLCRNYSEELPHNLIVDSVKDMNICESCFRQIEFVLKEFEE